MAEWLVHEIVFWFWCRWMGHESFPVLREHFTKDDDVASFRGCQGCGRVYPEDVDRFLDALERYLDG